MTISIPFRRAGGLAAGFLAALFLLAALPAQATNIEKVVSPGGLEIWLVRDATVPLIAIDFAFTGGAAQDPADKPGTANMAISTLDEGAGDLVHLIHQQSAHQQLGGGHGHPVQKLEQQRPQQVGHDRLSIHTAGRRSAVTR